MPKSICMLAHLYDPKRIIFPAYIQPKLDGVRAIWLHKEKRFISRNNKSLTIPQHIIDPILDSSFDLDGELIIPGKTFNEISGIVRHLALTPEKNLLEYVVFDTISEGLFINRFRRIIAPKHLQTIKILNHDELNSEHQFNINLNYEGSIIRNNTPYEFKRSFNLLKLKPTKEIICKITGLIEGTGKYENMLGALTVETSEGKVFNVGSGFTDEDRDCIWLRDVKHYENTLVKVKYQDLSEYGIPRFPIFKGFV